MAVDHKRQVIALRPNARCVETPCCGLIVFDGDEMLSGEEDPTHKEGQAWFRAFRFLMVRFREGIDKP